MNPTPDPGSHNLLQKVVDNGFCIGCGACAAVDQDSISIKLDSHGRYIAGLSATTNWEAAQQVCPFTGSNPDEDAIGERLFGADSRYDPKLGYHKGTYAGHVAEGSFRTEGSSGGMGTWLLHELLAQDEVDAVIHVQPDPEVTESRRLFRFAVATDFERVSRGSKSRYYPVEMSSVLAFVGGNPGRYAIVGLPCYIKAVRLLQQREPLFAERITHCIALVCGHLKSHRYAEMLAWQLDILPDQLTGINFRKKNPNAPATRYGTEATGEGDGGTQHREAPNADLYGTDWGQGMFKYQACDYCDDVVGETADITIGDAWLPQFNSDPGGTNVIIVRDQRFENLLQRGQREQRIELQALAPTEVVRSQRGGFFHRRDALAYRLHLWDEGGKWRPRKRVQPEGGAMNGRNRRKQRLRIQLAQQSHTHFATARDAGDLAIFEQLMKPVVRKYNTAARPLWKRAGRWVKRKMRKPSLRTQRGRAAR